MHRLPDPDYWPPLGADVQRINARLAGAAWAYLPRLLVRLCDAPEDQATLRAIYSAHGWRVLPVADVPGYAHFSPRPLIREQQETITDELGPVYGVSSPAPVALT